MHKEDLGFIFTNYMEDIFLDPYEIVIKPGVKPNAFYFILKGEVAICEA
jgi:hypothetical protein